MFSEDIRIKLKTMNCPAHQMPPTVIIDKGQFQIGTCCHAFRINVLGNLKNLLAEEKPNIYYEAL